MGMVTFGKCLPHGRALDSVPQSGIPSFKPSTHSLGLSQHWHLPERHSLVCHFTPSSSRTPHSASSCSLFLAPLSSLHPGTPSLMASCLSPAVRPQSPLLDPLRPRPVLPMPHCSGLSPQPCHFPLLPCFGGAVLHGPMDPHGFPCYLYRDDLQVNICPLALSSHPHICIFNHLLAIICCRLNCVPPKDGLKS